MYQLKNALLIAIVGINVLLTPTAFSKDQPLPAACASQCKTPYGEVLGIGIGNVPAYSNCSSDCVVFAPNKNEGTYTGIKWQCVEFARRWLLINKGVVYGDVDIAADIWGLNTVTRVKDKSNFKMLTYPNGDAKLPAVGDLLIYAKAFLKTGHVAVISKVDTKTHTIQVVEQNYNNTKWPKDFARSIPYVKHEEKYWLLDAYVLGWKRVTEQQATSM